MTVNTQAALDVDTVVRDYLELWNTTDPAARLAQLRDRWAEGAVYVDPMAEAVGVEAMNDLVGAVQGQFPGMVFTRVGTPDGHHAQVRFQWGLGPAGAEPLVIGFDVVTLDEAGRVLDVRGFLDKVPG